jgi:hypothetical protein
MYSGLLAHMMGYFHDLKRSIDQQIQVSQTELSDASTLKAITKGKRSRNFLHRTIVLRSLEVMELLLQLNMFEALENDNGFQPRDFYPFIVEYLFSLL